MLYSPTGTFHTQTRPWQRLQPNLGDRLSTASANSILPGLQSAQRQLHLGQSSDFALHVRQSKLFHDILHGHADFIVEIILTMEFRSALIETSNQFISLLLQQSSELRVMVSFYSTSWLRHG